ncbi:MerC domain-containing protein [Polaribacter sp.]|nr:MerC domain-containing protein [Polaribacter sp.]
MNLKIIKSDKIGILSSAMCFIHCLLTPILFALPLGNYSEHASGSFLWSNLDYLFLFIGFLAIFHSSKNTSKKVVKILFWVLWSVLFLLVINEKNELIHLPEIIMYAVTISLVILHAYNLKYCTCKEDNCCVSNHK